MANPRGYGLNELCTSNENADVRGAAQDIFEKLVSHIGSREARQIDLRKRANKNRINIGREYKGTPRAEGNFSRDFYARSLRTRRSCTPGLVISLWNDTRKWQRSIHPRSRDKIAA